MEKSYYILNRARALKNVGEGEVAVFFSGKAPVQSGDQYYSFFCNRDFLYLTGCEEPEIALVADNTTGTMKETLYLRRPDMMIERWHGKRLRAEDACAKCGVGLTGYMDELPVRLHQLLSGAKTLYVDVPVRADMSDALSYEAQFASECRKNYPALTVKGINPVLRELRTIKQPCEIDAMRHSIAITNEAVRAMMRASRPGIWEYELKAVYDSVLTSHNVLEPGFPSIISAGKNNFCIHYYSYQGQAQDGDMALADVGARYDYLVNDNSRGWPINGKFNEKQRLLYECALKTNDHMFSIIKPGMLHADVDRLSHEYCRDLLVEAGALTKDEPVSKLMWHGGAHHVGLDVHDTVRKVGAIEPGMVFCVDIGVYDEDWGIGFRIEDNCLVTESGCENLSASLPRTVAEVEAAIKG